jgi:hypothetical protein
LCPMGTGGLFPGVRRGRGVTLTTYLHLVPRSWMSWYYPGIYLEGLRKITQPPVRIASLRNKIWNQDLPSRKQESSTTFGNIANKLHSDKLFI